MLLSPAPTIGSSLPRPRGSTPAVIRRPLGLCRPQPAREAPLAARRARWRPPPNSQPDCRNVSLASSSSGAAASGGTPADAKAAAAEAKPPDLPADKGVELTGASDCRVALL